jgi:hypothetical protein
MNERGLKLCSPVGSVMDSIDLLKVGRVLAFKTISGLKSAR